MTFSPTRRDFLRASALGLATTAITGVRAELPEPSVVTVTGPVPARALGPTLPHEHILVDFVGAEKYNQEAWNDDTVVAAVLPLLKEVHALGGRTFVDCTPNYLGRDVVLLRRLAQESGLNIVTNTGYYGGSNHACLPRHAFEETASALAARWTAEFTGGIDGTDIKPGFIKISVNDGPLSEISEKLITAAAETHKQTGLAIASHTGPAVPAFEQIAILRAAGLSPSAFIWVHAGGEIKLDDLLTAAREGAWLSLDGLSAESASRYTRLLDFLKRENCLGRVLLSHDSGWFKPAEPNGGVIRGYTYLFREYLPALRQAGFSEAEITQIIATNPGEALALRVRKA